MLEEAVGESTCAAAEVGGGCALDVELEVGEGVEEFETAAGDEGVLGVGGGVGQFKISKFPNFSMAKCSDAGVG